MTQPIERRIVLPVEPEDEFAPQTTTPDQGMAMIERLADDLLPTLITHVDASSLGELEVRRNGWRIRLRRAYRDNGSEEAAARPRPSRSHPEGSAGGQESPPRADEPDGLVAAPAVGYYQPREGLSPGMNVRGGDLLGHVDVLGVQVEVVVPADGRLSRLLAEPGEAVEFGQPLARIEVESRG